MKSPAAYDVNVTNTGTFDSECSVLGFVSSDHEDAPINKELFDFARVGPPNLVNLLSYTSLPASVCRLLTRTERNIHTW